MTWDDIVGNTPTSNITVPGTWNTQGWGHPHYTNVLMPFPQEPPFAPSDDNPTGVYRRTFDLDADWSNRRTLLHLGGTDSMHLVFVNGLPIGFGKDTRLTSEYDITRAVRPGSNDLAVVVVRWSDASWLEDQDQWWLAGITREVLLLSMPHTHLFHLSTRTNLDGTNGELECEAHIGFSGTPERGYSVETRLETLDGDLVSAYVRDDDRRPLPYLLGVLGGAQPGQIDTSTAAVTEVALANAVNTQRVPILDRRSPGHTAQHGNVFPGHRVRFTASVPSVSPWSCESPTRYRLVVSLFDPSGSVVDIVSTLIGFRDVRLGTRELLLNGSPTLIRGVNRHDHDERTGCVMSRETMRLDIETMKRHNVNAVRMSHYPPDPYVLELCDELGLWVIDETNLESHARYRSLIVDPIYQNACFDRLVRMIRRDENHPSIFAWSLGNESGYGPAHDAMAAWARAYDETRVIHYEGPHRYDLGPHGPAATDIVCPMYPSIDRLLTWATRQATNPDDNRPLILCEYSHAMGNSNGSLADHDELFRTHHGLQGGFIWEWIDHGIAVGNDLNGDTTWAYGGFFGDEPNDGAFVADGLVWPNRVPHPGLVEAQHIWRPVRTSLTATQHLQISNERDHSTLADLSCAYEWRVDGAVVGIGVLGLASIDPQTHLDVELPPKPDAVAEAEASGSEIHLDLRWQLVEPTPWAPAGFVVAWDQCELTASPRTQDSTTTSSLAPDLPLIEMVDDRLTITGHYTQIAGPMSSYAVEGHNLITAPPEVRIWRARIDNDGVPVGELGLPGIGRTWDAWGLRTSQVRRTTDISRGGTHLTIEDTVVITPSNQRASVIVTETKHFIGDGIVRYEYHADVPDGLSDLPRLGTVFTLSELNELEWFGLGPHESYSDRRSSVTVGRFTSSVADQYVPYMHPQDHGRHEDTRWVAVHNGRVGLIAVASPDCHFSFSARQFDDADLEEAKTTADLIPRAHTILSIDHRVRGVGTGSCGPDTLPRYRITSGRYRWSFVLAPWRARGDDVSDVARRVRNLAFLP